MIDLVFIEVLLVVPNDENTKKHDEIRRIIPLLASQSYPASSTKDGQ